MPMVLQKGFVSVVKLLVAGLLVLGALFIPIPRYQNRECPEIDIDSPRCYPAGWKLGPSLWWQIFKGQKTVSQIVSPSPSPNEYPQYGHGPDYEWVAGRVEVYKLEGGCIYLVFSNEVTKENYFGIFTIEPQEFARENNLKQGDFVVLKGKVGKFKFSMACPPSTYQIEEIIFNSAKNLQLVTDLKKTINDEAHARKNLISWLNDNTNFDSTNNSINQVITKTDGYLIILETAVKMNGRESGILGYRDYLVSKTGQIYGIYYSK